MAWSLPAEGLSLLLSALQQAQLGLRAVLHILGLAPDIHGQPAWPFAYRIAGETLALDAGHRHRGSARIAAGTQPARAQCLAL